MTFRWLHAVWAVLGLTASVILVLAGGGHPPPIIFLPVVVVVWLAGHVGLAAARWLAVRGAAVGVESPRWPPSILVATVLCGLLSLVGLVQLVVTLMLRRPYPFYGSLWPLTMTIWVVHAACLTGLLLRKGWSRWVAALLNLGWAALLAWQIIDHVSHLRPVDLAELLLALGLIVALGALGGRLLSSAKVRTFLGS